MSLIAEVMNSEKQLERRLHFQCGRQNIMYYEFCQVMIIQNDQAAGIGPAAL